MADRNLVERAKKENEKQLLIQKIKTITDINALNEVVENIDTSDIEFGCEILLAIIYNIDSVEKDLKHNLLMDIIEKTNEIKNDKNKVAILLAVLAKIQIIDEASRNAVLDSVIDGINEIAEDKNKVTVLQAIVDNIEIFNERSTYLTTIIERIDDIDDEQFNDNKAKLILSIIGKLDSVEVDSKHNILTAIIGEINKIEDDKNKVTILLAVIKKIQTIDDTFRNMVLDSVIDGINEIAEDKNKVTVLQAIVDNIEIFNERSTCLTTIIKKISDIENEQINDDKAKLLLSIVGKLDSVEDDTKHDLLTAVIEKINDIEDDKNKIAILSAVFTKIKIVDEDSRNTVLDSIIGRINEIKDDKGKVRVLQAIVDNIEIFNERSTYLITVIEKITDIENEQINDDKAKLLLNIIGKLDSVEESSKHEVLHAIVANSEKINESFRHSILMSIVKKAHSITDDAIRFDIIQDIIDKIKVVKDDFKHEILFAIFDNVSNTKNDQNKTKALLAIVNGIDEECSSNDILRDIAHEIDASIVDESMKAEVLQTVVQTVVDKEGDFKENFVTNILLGVFKGIDKIVDESIKTETLENVIKKLETIHENIMDDIFKITSDTSKIRILKTIINTIDNASDNFKDIALNTIVTRIDEIKSDTDKVEILLATIDKIDNREKQAEILLEITERINNIKIIDDAAKIKVLLTIVGMIDQIDDTSKNKILNLIITNVDSIKDNIFKTIILQSIINNKDINTKKDIESIKIIKAAKDKMPLEEVTRYSKPPQVSIQTWGTGKFGSNGMLHYLGEDLFGGNVGHAAIELEFPADQKGKELIEKFCYKDGREIIPFERKTYTTQDGIKENYYVVRFSWWPGNNNTFSLNSFKADQRSEKLGVDVHYADRFSYLANDHRVYRGKLGEQTKTLGPLVIAHERDLINDPFRKELISAKLNIGILLENLNTATLLLKKLNAKSNDKFSKTELLMLQNLLPKEEYETFKKENLTREDIAQVIEIVKKHETEININITKQKELISKYKSQLTASLQKHLLNFTKINSFYDFLQKTISFNQSITLNDEIKEKLSLITNWQEVLGKKEISVNELTVKDLSTLLSHVEQQKQELHKKIEELNKQLYDFSYENYLTFGAPPDDQIIMPLLPLDSQGKEHQNGLDATEMLQKMRELVDDKSKFTLKDKNCSETVGRILEAGCTISGLKHIAKTRAFGAFGNPQEVVNKAARIQDYLYKHTTPGIIERLNNFRPIAQINGALLKILTNDSSSRLVKFAASLAIIPMGALAFASFMARGVFNPLGAFNDCRAIIDFAFSHDSRLLKIAVSLKVVPIAAIFAIPATIQYGIKTIIVNPIRSLFSKLLGAKNEPEVPLEVQEKMPAIKEMASYVKSKEQAILRQQTPAETLNTFIDILSADEKSIPYFTEKAVKQILKTIEITQRNPAQLSKIITTISAYISKIKEQNPEKFALLPLSLQGNIDNMSVQDIYKTLCDASIERAKTKTIVTEAESSKAKASAKIVDKVLSDARPQMHIPVSQHHKKSSAPTPDRTNHLTPFKK